MNSPATEVQNMLAAWGGRILESPLTPHIGASFAVRTNDAGKIWIYRCNEKPSVDLVDTVREDCHCTISLDAKTASGLIYGTKTVQQAMLQGGLSLEGEVSKSLLFFSIVCPGGRCEW